MSTYQVSKYTGFTGKGQSSHGLLHCNLCHWGQVVMGVLAQHNSAEKYSHDAWNHKKGSLNCCRWQQDPNDFTSFSFLRLNKIIK